jgi:hypothetical protein
MMPVVVAAMTTPVAAMVGDLMPGHSADTGPDHRAHRSAHDRAGHRPRSRAGHDALVGR